ncbi:MAG: hypothetical protein IPJ49_06760 [Candidatus Obscuribacter sp.]|nr:hypothetical protein [Candidatus Obscuribacter sp.]
MGFEIGSVADWAQALTNTIVLLYIYRQLKLMNIQMIQNDDQERSRRSWEFVQFVIEEFNNFVTLGVKVHGAKEFMSEASTKMSLLMTSWGAQVKARQLLIG